MTESTAVTLYTDGSTQPKNPGPGGWGFVLLCPGHIILGHGRHPEETTNNRMELTAILKGFSILPHRTIVSLHSDSEWCLNALFGNWNISKNLDLIAAIRSEQARLLVHNAQHVRAHKGHVWNELADQLAGSGYFAIPKQETLHDLSVIALTWTEGYREDFAPRVRQHAFSSPKSLFRLSWDHQGEEEDG